jgi:hypothetical protein
MVNHKDGNKENNVEANLEWTSYSNNTKHYYGGVGRMKAKNARF